MLEHYKEEYSDKNIQFILLDPKGRIVESDQAFIVVEIGEDICDVHPFFESFSSISENIDEEISYNCVNLNIHNREYTTDIKITRKKEGILIVIYDLTEHYIEYQAVAQSRNESIINEELIILKNNELEERERFKNKFIQNFSHELRNPLTSIISITNILGGTELKDEQRKMIHFLKDSNLNLKLMLEDILSISMISSGKLVLRDTTFNLSHLLQLLEFTYKTKAKQKGLDFQLISDIKIPELVEGDRLRLFQVLTNLLDNALKYTEKGSVSLHARFNQKRANKVSLQFQVVDTGIGIPEESLETIFESFSQLNIQNKQTGTGLGLAIVKGLLELMQSEIKVRSNINEGSIFYFDIVLKFPLHQATEPILKGTNKKYQGKLKSKNESKYRILLVEDDENIQTILFKSLMATNSFYIDLVNDGATVLEEVIDKAYDLIIMDINLPNISGDQVTRLIRDFPFKNIKKIPIIGLTANAFESDIKDYLEAGMNVVLSKPYEEERLLNTIFKLLK